MGNVRLKNGLFECGNVAVVAKTLNARPLPMAAAAGTKQFLSPVSSIGQSI